MNFMVRAFRLALVLTALVVVWMSPGVYLVRHGVETEVLHFHYSETHADSEHTHEYLAHLFQKIVVDVVPSLLVSAQVWIALNALSGLWQWIDADFLHGGKWEPILLLPPPKAAISWAKPLFV